MQDEFIILHVNQLHMPRWKNKNKLIEIKRKSENNPDQLQTACLGTTY